MISVLVVEDDPVALAAHADYVARVPGFRVVGTAATGAAALRSLGTGPTDLILLDMNLPDLHGLEVCRRLRAGGHGSDVIAVTSARDLPTVRAAVSHGVVQYLIKPFVFAAFRDKLEQYRGYRARVAGEGVLSGQHDVDRMLAALHGRGPTGLPKGMSPESLDAVAAALRGAGVPRSASELAEALGTSRITARRYLEHLTDAGLVTRSARYGRTGRPELEYRWNSHLGRRGSVGRHDAHDQVVARYRDSAAGPGHLADEER